MAPHDFCESKVHSYCIQQKLYEAPRVAVYRAVRESDHRGVVLKVLDATCSEPGDLERLQHEFDLEHELDSPAVVKALALETLEGSPTLVTEDVGGEPLERLLTAGEPMAVDRFLPLAIAVARAVAVLHGLRLVHRDLKPGNIIVIPRTGEVRLTGLGLASRFPVEQAASRSHLIEGTLAYMSPEQTGRVNHLVDGRSDLYSLGVLYFQMLSGRLPFEAADPLGWVHRHVACKPPAPRDLVPSLPDTLSNIVLRLLAKAPEERYQSAKGLEHDLETCLRQWQTQAAITAFPLGTHDWPGRLTVPRILYGREKETHDLVSILSRIAETGSSAFVVVSGYSGIGKTSLVAQLRQPLLEMHGHFLSGKFEQYKRDVPHVPLVQACRQLLVELLTESADHIQRFSRTLEERVGVNAELLCRLLPELEVLIGKAVPRSETPLADAENRLCLAFQRFLSAFAAKEHPLAIFFDDLQWADPASLRLLERLVMGPKIPYLLLLGAYRENEVDATHPLTPLLARCREARANLHEIRLGALSASQFTRLVDDALGAARGDAARLADLVYAKTAGNPLFAIHFLTALEARGLLTFDRASGRWHWDVDSISAESASDSVVDLLAARVRALPSEAQHLLKVCACLGNATDTSALAAAMEREMRLDDPGVVPVLEQGLLLHAAGTFRFAHDRIQEAAYSLVPESERPTLHTHIGHALLRHTPADRLDTAIFDIVNQLNRGHASSGPQAERDELAQLNVRASRKAAAAAAFATALEYCNKAIALLPSDAWLARADLTFDLHMQATWCALACGRFEEVRVLLDVLRPHIRTRAQLVAACAAESRYWIVRSEFRSAVDVTLDCLRKFGIVWSPHPTREAVHAEYARVQSALAGRDVCTLVDLPPMVDPDALMVTHVLANVMEAAGSVDTYLFALVAMRMALITIASGRTDVSPFGYGCLGMALGMPFFREFDAAARWGELARSLVEKSDRPDYVARAHLTWATCQWVHDVHGCLATIRRTFDVAIETGDLNFVGLARDVELWTMLIVGTPLSRLTHRAREAMAVVRGAELPFSASYVALFQGLLRQLGDAAVTGADHKAEPPATTNPDAARTLRLYGCVWSLEAALVMGSFEDAVAMAEEAQRLLDRTFPWFADAELHYFHALALAGQVDLLSQDARPEAIAKLRAVAELVARLTHACPEFYADQDALVRAELSRIDGQPHAAADLYEQAIRLGSQRGFVHHEALALETASRFYRARGFDLIANVYLREARACYSRWGAECKVRQIDRQQPNLPLALPGRSLTTFVATTSQLDLFSIVRASQAISGAVDEGQLLSMLLQVVLREGAATTAGVIFVRGETLTLEAEGSIENMALVGSRPVSDSVRLPLSLLLSVLRTKSPVTLDNATVDAGAFRSDPYFSRAHPRSVLCLPVLRQTDVIALLYLENELIAGAFTAERLVALELLAAQAAISIDNALLLRRERLARAEADLLANASKILGESLDYEVTLDRLASTCVPVLADWCVVDVVEVGRTRRVASAHRDPGRRPLLQRLTCPIAEPASLASHSVCFEDVTELRACAGREPPSPGVLHDLAPCAVAIVPMASQGQLRGAIAFGSAQADFHPGSPVLSLAEEVGRRAALAIEHAHLYRAAQDAVRLRDEFIAVASHELRTPLTALLLKVQACKRKVDRVTPESARRACTTVECQATRLTSLVDEMLTVGSLGEGQPRARLADVDLVTLARAAVTRLETESSQAACPITIFAPAAVIGRWDAAQLEHAIVNILRNAIKFGAGRPIELTIGSPGDRVTLDVTDHGIGIPAEAIPHVFDRFYRGVSTRSYGGLGLGLYVVRRVVEAMGGSVRASSVPGSSTTITMELPTAA